MFDVICESRKIESLANEDRPKFDEGKEGDIRDLLEQEDEWGDVIGILCAKPSKQWKAWLA